MSRVAPVYLCGVDQAACRGAKSRGLNHGLGPSGINKSHASSEDAFACRKADLLSRGYVALDNRALRPPDGGPIVILTKPSRYGVRLRMGKEGTRHMPDYSRSGIIISK